MTDDPLLAGRYQVGRLLGRGGMAVVHLGQDTRLHRQVAIKLLRIDLADDPTAQHRFRREAQSAAALNHPSIVAVFDTGEGQTSGTAGAEHTIPFIVMEYVQGMTLREMLRDSSRRDATSTIALPPSGRAAPTSQRIDRDHGIPLPIDQAVAITAHVLAALGYSHHNGIVHRDIKPGNVMLTPAGAVKVMDFGIARALADTSATVTSAQTVVGTAQYLSPEQARGEHVDSRSDLYSTGCLLYELLTGRPPFIGDSPVAIAYQHVREAPQPPSTYNPAVGDELDRVVLHALTKDREARYQDAQAFSDDLLNALDGRPVDAPPTTVIAAPMPAPPRDLDVDDIDSDEPKRSRAGAYIALAIGVLLLAGLGWFLADRFITSEPPPQLVSVPTVTGLDKSAARAAIEKAGFTYAEGTPLEDEQLPVDAVVSQTPGGGTETDAGATVTVVLSLGSGTVHVPDLAGRSQQEARDALAAAGLVAGNVDSEDSVTVARNTVIRTDPAVGAAVARDSQVNLIVSSGRVTMPSLAGLRYEEAKAQLASLGLKVATDFVTTTAQSAGTVISSSPGAGSVEQGSTVELRVARAPIVTPTPTPTVTPTPTPTVTPTPTPTTESPTETVEGDA